MKTDLERLILSGSSTRREFLAHSAKLTAAISLGGLPGMRGDRGYRMASYPFTLGIASGDPLPDGFVLWTRLAPEPLEGGGMPPERVAVQWEVARDENFRVIVRNGSTVATPELAHAVHVDVRGLEPGRPYWYRFMAGNEVSPVGRVFTAPPANSSLQQLRFAYASCQNYQNGFYTAWAHLADEDIQLVLHLGDYIYESGIAENAVRPHNSPAVETLEAYRNRYALYKTDPNLQRAHTLFPFVVTWDDHEVMNNYAGDYARGWAIGALLARRAAAYQAYYEHMPLREPALPHGADLQLYRRIRYGDLITFNVLDTRQYRSPQPCNDGWRSDAACPQAHDPSQTMLGPEQWQWLEDGLTSSRTRWNVLAHGVPIAPTGRPGDDGLEQSMDKWAGYAAERDRLLRLLHDAPVRNAISIVGDVHQNWLSEMRTQFYTDDAPIVGVEFVGTSITSGGDGVDRRPETSEPWIAANPHVLFNNSQRGYVRCTVTPERWVTDYRVVEYVSRPGAPIKTRASFAVQDGVPGVTPV
ncbi:MAG TPA: alkaline phosphatase D family protein [Longimicrobiaceae bacterium]